jgi:hypothetical protein
VIIVSTFEAPQPESWLTGIGRKRKSASEGGEWEMPPFELEQWVKILITVVVSVLESPRPKSSEEDLGGFRGARTTSSRRDAGFPIEECV